MTGKKALVVSGLFSVLLMLVLAGACFCQQTDTATAPSAIPPVLPEIWHLVPADSQFVVAYDGRPENPSNQAVLKFADKEQLQRQQYAVRKAVESFATLFGVSIDFATEIDPWLGDQMAFAWVPGQDKSKEMGYPVLIITSYDEAAANRTLDELLAPWQRVGEVKTTVIEGGASVRSFMMKKKGVEVYAAARGPVVAISPSVKGIQAALSATGFAPDSVGERTFRALSGSSFYVFAEPSLLKNFIQKQVEIPVQGVGIGISAMETGSKLRVVGFPSDALIPLLTQVLPTSRTGVAETNPGIPGNSLVVATLPDLSAALSLVSMFGGARNPQMELLGALAGTRISGSLTAVLPRPAGVISAAAESEAAAKEKAGRIAALLPQAKVPTAAAPQIPGLQVNAIKISKDITLLWAQVGQYLLMGSDALALQQAAMAASGQTESITQVARYTETIQALPGSNLQTVYINLAPVQGLGYLAEGLGLSQVTPIHAALVSSVENLQALGIGVGFDGQMVSAIFFLRSKPGAHPSIGPAMTLGTAVGAAVLLPVFARARDAARRSECQANLKQLALAAIEYADDHNGKLPSRLTWQNDLKPYLQRPLSELTCPDGKGGKIIFAFNKNLGGLNINYIQNPADVVMFFTARPDLPNASGSRADVALAHDGYGHFAYVEGYVQSLKEAPTQYHWVPKYATPKPVKPAKKK